MTHVPCTSFCLGPSLIPYGCTIYRTSFCANLKERCIVQNYTDNTYCVTGSTFPASDIIIKFISLYKPALLFGFYSESISLLASPCANWRYMCKCRFSISLNNIYANAVVSWALEFMLLLSSSNLTRERSSDFGLFTICLGCWFHKILFHPSLTMAFDSVSTRRAPPNKYQSFRREETRNMKLYNYLLSRKFKFSATSKAPLLDIKHIVVYFRFSSNQ